MSVSYIIVDKAISQVEEILGDIACETSKEEAEMLKEELEGSSSLKVMKITLEEVECSSSGQ